MLFNELPINIIILLFEYIKDHLLNAYVRLQIIPDCPYRNFSCFFLREMKFSRRNTAERNAFQSILCCKLQAGLIAVSKLSAMFVRQAS